MRPSGQQYELVIYQNPKVGHKPPRLVPLMTKLRFLEEGPLHRWSGEELNPVVVAYKDFPRAVTGAN